MNCENLRELYVMFQGGGGGLFEDTISVFSCKG